MPKYHNILMTINFADMLEITQVLEVKINF
jgi:hypothetical protein